MNRVFYNRDLSFELKLRLMKRYFLSVLNYGTQEWTMKTAGIRTFHGRRLSCGCITMATENFVGKENHGHGSVNRNEKEKEVILTIKRRKFQCRRHIGLLGGEKLPSAPSHIARRNNGKKIYRKETLVAESPEGTTSAPAISFSDLQLRKYV